MAQHKSVYSHKEFLTNANPLHHQRTMITRPYPQFHRIVLRSVDRDNGTARNNAIFLGVTLNERLTTPACLIVESFNLINGDADAYTNEVLEVRMRNVPQPRSWDSSHRSPSDLLCTVSGYTYYNQSPSADAVGVPVLNPTAFQNENVNIYFTSPNDSILTDFTSDWVLVLNVIAYDGSTTP